MNRDKILYLLREGSAPARLRAARAAGDDPALLSLEDLGAAIAKERAYYVRRALKAALDARVGTGEVTAERVRDVPEQDALQVGSIERAARERFANVVLHELGKRIGFLDEAAGYDISDYETSNTKREADRLRGLFEALEMISTAASTPERSEFDLANLVRDVAKDELRATPIEPSFQGPEPLILRSDARLIRLILANAIRNAREACDQMHSPSEIDLTISWGSSDREAYVTVFDNGPGLGQLEGDFFGWGNGNKDGQSGFGLSISRDAVDNLGGTCALTNVDGGGAKFELRISL